MYTHARCICSLCGLALVCASVCVVIVHAYCNGSALQQIIAFCSGTVPIIGTLQFALPMDKHNIS